MSSPPESDQFLKRELSSYRQVLVKLLEAEGIPLDALTTLDNADSGGPIDHFTEQIDSRLDSLDSKIDTVLIEVRRLKALSESNQFLPQSTSVPFTMHESFWRRGNRIISFASGGAFLGGFVAQLPGAVLGVVAGAVLGLLIRVEPAD